MRHTYPRTDVRKPALGRTLSGHLAQSLACAYIMNEGGGATLIDESPNRNNGAFAAGAASPTWAPGVPQLSGYGLKFVSASSQYVTVASKAVTTSTQGTIAFWFNLATVANNEIFFGYGGAAHASAGFFTVAIGSSFFVRVTAGVDGTGTTGVIRGNTTPVANTWYHCVVTSDSTAWKIYMNGQAETLTVVAGANNGQWIGNTTVTAPSQTLLGEGYSNGALNVGNYLNGMLDSFLMWDRPLTASEARDLYVNQFAFLTRRLRRQA